MKLNVAPNKETTEAPTSLHVCVLHQWEIISSHQGPGRESARRPIGGGHILLMRVITIHDSQIN